MEVDWFISILRNRRELDSEGWKIMFLKSEIMKFWKLISNLLVKNIYKTSLNFWNSLSVVRIRSNLELDATQNSKFQKFVLTPRLHLFSWLKNILHFNFRFKIDRITCIWFLHPLRPYSLHLGKVLKNHLDLTYQNQNDKLILGV